MLKPMPPAFDPKDVAETNFTSLPEPFRTENSRRSNRRLGDHAGLKNFGVNLTRLVPGSQSSFRHAHEKQEKREGGGRRARRKLAVAGHAIHRRQSGSVKQSASLPLGQWDRLVDRA